MSKSLNRVDLIGNIATDPKELPGENRGVTFKLATNDKHYSRQNKTFQSTAEFHTIKCWKDVDYILGLKKGSTVFVSGKIHYHNYNTPDGKRGISPEIFINSIIHLNKPNINKDNK